MADRPARKLAVILHADVVGSTTLVQRDESLAHERIQGVFNRLAATISEYGGKAREIRGDALVAEFSRASDAVCAALVFQAENIKHSGSLSDDIRPEIRVGISMGEVVVADGTLTGAGVVLAQRLEQLAQAGAVVIQGSVAETVPTRLPLAFESLGERTLKGFDQPVRAFAVCQQPGSEVPAPESRTSESTVPGVVADTARERPALELPDKPSIAVLPFTNMGSDPEQEYFSDGVAEDIITELSRFSNLLVIARNSSFRYRGESVHIKQVGQELGVRYVLEGSVRKGGNRVRINVQLIDALNDSHIWANRYDRTLEDVFAVQDEIVEVVASTVPGQVKVAETARRKSRPTSSLSAYDYYLRGLQLGSSGTYTGDILENFIRAKGYLEQAISLDPAFADALSELAIAHVYLSYYGSTSPGSMEEAGHYAERAVVQDSRNATAHSVLGMCLHDSGNHERAAHHFEHAMKLNPNHTYVLAQYAMFLGNCGRTDEALAMLQSAIRRDPYHPEWLYDCLGEINWLGGRYKDAIAAYEKLMAKPFWVLCDIACCYAYLGMDEEARAHAKAFLDGLPEGWSVEDEVAWGQTRLRYEADKRHHLEGYRKAGLIK